MRRSLSVVFLLSISIFYISSLQAQVSKANKEAYKEAEALTNKGQLRGAAAIYKQILEAEPDNRDIQFTLALTYLKENRGDLALPYISKIYEEDHNYYPGIRFMMAVSYHHDHNFEEAEKYYRQTRSRLLSLTNKQDDELAATTALIDVVSFKVQPDPYDDARERSLNLLNKRLEECNNGKELIVTPVDIRINNVGEAINSPYDDYVPAVSPDETMMVFTSKREGSTGGKMTDTHEYYEDVYISKGQNGKWMPATPLGRNINSADHDAAVSISPDGKTLFLYKTENDGDFYISKYQEGDWSRPQSMKKINSKAAELSITMTADGQTIYFSSNREGGYGGMDIYKSTLDKKGNWGSPTNLGATVNTPYDEDAPFIHSDNKTLYFSSKGHKTMGGFDIFLTTLEDGRWSQPENIGYPISTALNNIFFVLSGDGKHGYYSSEQADGFGGEDIYRIDMPSVIEMEKLEKLDTKPSLAEAAEKVEIAKPVMSQVAAPVMEIKEDPITIFRGKVIDEDSKASVAMAKVILTDKATGEVILEDESDDEGRFVVTMPSGKNYVVEVTKEKYLFHTEEFDIPESEGYQEVEKDIALKGLKVGAKIVLKNIFYDFAKATLRQESVTELERLLKIMNDNPNLKIELGGHTDNVGTETNNQKLSEARAKSVVDYLLQKGVSKDRLTYAGYGEMKPVATNETDEGRQLNRRTEFKVISN